MLLSACSRTRTDCTSGKLQTGAFDALLSDKPFVPVFEPVPEAFVLARFSRFMTGGVVVVVVVVVGTGISGLVGVGSTGFVGSFTTAHVDVPG